MITDEYEYEEARQKFYNPHTSDSIKLELAKKMLDYLWNKLEIEKEQRMLEAQMKLEVLIEGKRQNLNDFPTESLSVYHLEEEIYDSRFSSKFSDGTSDIDCEDSNLLNQEDEEDIDEEENDENEVYY